jgi:hypothetical protein
MYLFTDKRYINPFSLAIAVFLIIAVVGIRVMTKKSQQALEDLRLRERSENDEVKYSEFMISFNKRVAIYLIFVAVFYVYIIGIIGFNTYIEDFGIVSTLVLSMIIYPFGYIPIVVEFVTVFASVNFILPKKVSAVRPKVAFLDPRDSGGFHMLGDLFNKSYYFYTLCLLLYIGYIYGPAFAPTVTASVPRVGSLETAFFMFAWVFGLVALGSSILVVHRLMSKEKEAHLRELEEQFKNSVDDEYDILSADLYDNPEFEKAQKRKEEVQSMSEYPMSAGVSKQIVFTILLPQALQSALQII